MDAFLSFNLRQLANYPYLEGIGCKVEQRWQSSISNINICINCQLLEPHFDFGELYTHPVIQTKTKSQKIFLFFAPGLTQTRFESGIKSSRLHMRGPNKHKMAQFSTGSWFDGKASLPTQL
jgi:hypothetical protein